MKWLIAFVAVAVLLTAGWLLYNSAIGPPVAETPTPVLPVTPPVTPVTPPVVPVTPVTPPVQPAPVVPVPLVPPNFIVPDEVWKSASRLVLADGTEVRGAISFSNVPVGTKLFAPVDGWYVHALGTMLGEEEHSMIVLSQNPNLGEGDIAFQETMRALFFVGRLIEVSNFRPQKGEPFAEIKDNLPFPAHYYGREISLLIMLDKTWGEKSDRSITDSRTYLWTATQQLSPTK